MKQIQSLKMDKSGMQRYFDQFVCLMKKLNWNPEDETVLYQFKQGLEPWLVKQLSVAESNYLLSLETSFDTSQLRPISVHILSKLTLRIEANFSIHSGQKRTLHVETTHKKPLQC